MADLADVLNKIRDEAAKALEDAGLAQPSTTSKGIRIYRGWPGEALDADLAKGIANVTIYPRAGVANVMDGSIQDWQENPRPSTGLTVSAVGQSITFAGTSARPGSIAAVVADRRGWTLVLTQGQTAESVASSFQTALAADGISAVVEGPVLTLPDAIRVRAGVYASGTERREIRRQEQGVLLSVWAPSPVLRDRIASVLDLHFAGETGRISFPMPDGSRTTVRYAGTVFDDAGQLHPLYRRDLALLAEYSTIQLRELPPVAAVDVMLKTIPPGVETTRVF
jgi:hypothetical protein